MKSRFVAAGALAALSLTAPAQALEITGAGDAGYVNGPSNTNEFFFGGDALFAFQYPGLQAQLSASDTHLSYSPFSADLIDIGSDIFWRDSKGTVGGSFTYHSISGGGTTGSITFTGSAALTSYGAFGEWYLSPDATMGFKGGGYGGDASGLYLGTGLEYYWTRNFALGMEYNYVKPNSASGLSVIGLGGEYMPWQSVPISFELGYSYASGGGTSSSSFGMAVKFRFGSSRNGDLMGWDRGGPIQWNGALPL